MSRLMRKVAVVTVMLVAVPLIAGATTTTAAASSVRHIDPAATADVATADVGAPLTSTLVFADDFSSLPGGQRFSDDDTLGGWQVVYAGYGWVRATTTPSLMLRPAVSTRPDQTHAALVATTRDFTDFTAHLRVRTDAQLRQGSPPNPWETAWVLWGYHDDSHFYSLVLKPNGWELGKEDPAYPGAQRFLRTGSNRLFPVGKWYDVQITQVSNVISVVVDGVALTSYTDTQRPYLSGALALYDEDSQSEFANVVVADAP